MSGLRTVCSIAVVATIAMSTVCLAERDRDHAPQMPARRSSTHLTEASPQAEIALPARPTPTSLLVLRVLDLKNPARAAISLDVALVLCSSKQEPRPEPVASLGVFPSDQAGSYAVDPNAALGRLRARGVSNLRDVCLRVRVRLSRAQESLSGVDITLAEPEWRAER